MTRHFDPLGGVVLETKYEATATPVPGRSDMQKETPAHIAGHVLWYFGAGGIEPGTFIKRLLDLIACADAFNEQILRNGYPDYVHAFNLGQSRGGIGVLQRLVNGDDDDHQS